MLSDVVNSFEKENLPSFRSPYKDFDTFGKHGTQQERSASPSKFGLDFSLNKDLQK